MVSTDRKTARGTCSDAGSIPARSTENRCRLISPDGRGSVNNQSKALSLAKLGLHVFPCGVDSKRPITDDGFNSATTDPEKIKALWGKNDYRVGVWCGPSGIVVLDIDVKVEDGAFVKDGWASLEEAWLTPDDTFTYTTVGGEGSHYIYQAPDDITLNGSTRYRGMKDVDRRAGGSYVVWAGDVPESRDVFAPAPKWLCDPITSRGLDSFTGTVKDWYETLTPGEPSVLVRAAMDRVRERFEEQNGDLSHGEIIEFQHNAVRLGAEGHAGVDQLLALLEELTLSRTGSHTRPPEEWEYEFQEGLASGIRKYGAAIELRESLPEYSMALVPEGVVDNLINGEPSGRDGFTDLLSALVRSGADPLVATSVLWNAPRTMNVAREWGLEFVHKRVTDALKRSLEPTPGDDGGPQPNEALVQADMLSDEEKDIVKAYPTFIDYYCEQSYKSKGWITKPYAIQAAWTLLSMAFGYRAFVGVGKGLPVNLWFITLGYSATGKTEHLDEQKRCLNLLLHHEDEAYFNVGAGSSPEAMHEVLLERDKRPSIMLHDEASGFFKNLATREWMSGIEDQLAEWYSGNVPPVNKVRLKELKGKSAETSFNMSMFATPDRLLKYINLDMFDSGFLARVNWVWGPEPRDDDTRFDVNESQTDDQGQNPIWFDVVNDLIAATRAFKSPRIRVTWEPEVRVRALEAVKQADKLLRSRGRYESTQWSVQRFKETIWRCAALNALYRGSKVISMPDMLSAIYYAQQWLDDLSRVVEKAGAGEFSGRMDEVEAFVRGREGGATSTVLYNHFKRFMRFGVKDVDSVLEALIGSGRLRKDTSSKIVKYVVKE